MGQTVFEVTSGLPLNDQGFAGIEYQPGEYFVTGSVKFPDGAVFNEQITMSYNSSGNLTDYSLWGTDADEYPHKILAYNERIYVWGSYYYSADSGAAYLLTMNSEFDSLNLALVNGPSIEVAHGLVLGQDNMLYLCGRTTGVTQNSSDPADAIIAKANLNGDILWWKNHGRYDVEDFDDLVYLDSDELLLAGYTGSYTLTDGVEEYFDGYLAKFDTAGNLIWERNVNAGNFGFHESFNSIDVSDDGSVYAVGYNDAVGGPISSPVHAWMVKLDTAGNEIWNKHFWPGSGFYEYYYYNWNNSVLQTVLSHPEGGCVVAGVYETRQDIDSVTYDSFLIRFDEDGNEVWRQNYGNNVEDDLLYDMTLTSDGGYLLTGTKVRPGTSTDYFETWLLKTDAYGCVQAEHCISSVAPGPAVLSIQLYPNPASGQITIEAPQELLGNSRLLLYNSLGQQVSSTAITAPKQTIPLNGLAAGIYLYRLSTPQGVAASGKLLVQ